MTCMGARGSSKFGQIGPPTAELAALERLKKKSPWTYNGKTGVATFSRLFLIRSISYLQVTMTYMRAWMSLKFGQISPLVPTATNRVIMEKKTMLPLFLGCFLSDPFHTRGNDDMHVSSEEFEFLQDRTTDCGVSCP